MKILLFGLGSIGKRHVRLLMQYYQHELFAYRSGVGDSVNDLGIAEINDWSAVEKLKPDIAFITNPTKFHLSTALECAQRGYKLFIEKPIGHSTDGLDQLLKIVQDKKLVTYVAYNLRFHPLILKLKEMIANDHLLHMRVECSSYLPDWRPGRRVEAIYSARQDNGGGVILDLSHELDYISFLLGGMKELSGNFAKSSNVTVDAEDYADILIKTDKTAVNLHLNYFSRIKKRQIQADFQGKTVNVDLINNSLTEYGAEDKPTQSNVPLEPDYTYTEQLQYFFANINNPKMMNNLPEAAGLFRQILKFKTGEKNNG